MAADEMLTWLTAALVDQGSYSEICNELQRGAPKDPSYDPGALVSAFGYHLLERSQTEGREREQAPYGPMMEFDDQRFPQRLSDVDEGVLATWATAFDAIEDPRLRSRMGDLLWLRRCGERPDLYAREATIAMVSLSQDTTWREMERIRVIVRAMEISIEIGDSALQQKVADRIVGAAEVELGTNSERPGISLRLIDALMMLPEERRPEATKALLDQAEAVYGTDPWQLDTITDLKSRLATAEEQAYLRLNQVGAWRTQAAQATGIARVSHLEHALELANAFGLKDKALDLRVEIQEMRSEDLGLKTVSGETSIPTEQVEQFINLFLSAESLTEALIAFGGHGPPGGEPDDLIQAVRQRMTATPFQFLVTRVVIDPDQGFAIFRASDEASHLRAELAHNRQFAAQIWSIFALDILGRMRERYNNPSHEELTAAFVGDLIDEALAGRFARALELLWNGEPDESAHLAAPRIETVLRELARRLSIPIINEPRGEKVGGVRTLGGILEALEGAFPTPGWHIYLRSLLVDPLGANLRNVVAHGLRTSVSAQDASLLIHSACFLRALTVSEVDPNRP